MICINIESSSDNFLCFFILDWLNLQSQKEGSINTQKQRKYL